GGLGLEGEAGVVQLQLVQRVAQIGQLVTVDRIEPAEDHRLGILVAGQGLTRSVAGRGHRLTRPRLADVLDAGDEVAHFPWAESLHRDAYGRAHAHFLDVMHRVRLHEAKPRAGFEGAVDDADGAHHTAVLVIGRIEDQR